MIRFHQGSACGGMRWARPTALALLIGLSCRAGAHWARPRHPATCMGLKAGYSTDADVRRLYGNGYFVKDEDHLGGRYYVDVGRRATLHVTIGVDRFISLVEYQAGVHLGRRPTASVLRQATTSRLDPAKRTQDGLFLGASVVDILHKYSRPTKKSHAHGQERTLFYTPYNTGDAASTEYEGELRFRNNRLVYVSLYNGE